MAEEKTGRKKEGEDDGPISEMRKLEEAVKQLETVVVWPKYRAQSAAPDDSGELERRRAALARRLLDLVDTIRGVNPAGHRVSGIAIDNSTEALGKRVFTYDELSSYLIEKGTKFVISEGVLDAWRDIEKTKDWKKRLWKTKSIDEQRPKNPLEIYLQVIEKRLRSLEAYGKDFKIDRNNLRYEGNPEAVLKAFEYGLVDDMIVRAYPSYEVKNDEDIEMSEENWLLSQLKNAGFISEILYFYSDHVASLPTHQQDRKMRQASNEGIIEFGCRFKKGLSIRKINLSIPEEIHQFGGHFPSMTSLLHYLYNHPVAYGSYKITGVENKTYPLQYHAPTSFFDSASINVTERKHREIEFQDNELFIL